MPSFTNPMTTSDWGDDHDDEDVHVVPSRAVVDKPSQEAAASASRFNEKIQRSDKPVTVLPRKQTMNWQQQQQSDASSSGPPRRDNSMHYNNRNEKNHQRQHDNNTHRNERNFTRHESKPNEEREVVKHEIPEKAPYTAYVGNLPYEVAEENLAGYFAGLNIVHLRMPMDREANRPKGFAYVEFKEASDLAQALKLNGTVIASREIRVDVAAPQTRKYETHNEMEASEAPTDAKRPSLKLLPRSKTVTSAVKDGEARKAGSIFGAAKPRDEKAYMQRKLSADMDQRKSSVSEEAVVEEKTDAPEKTKPARYVAREGKSTTTTSTQRGKASRSDTKWTRDRSSSIEKRKTYKKQPEKKEDNDAFIKRAHVDTIKVKTVVTNGFASLLDSDSDSDSN